ncbi:serine/threonine-protein kinase [Streptomyces sp. NPDC093094]|uniref:serine/threonine-protein kinase n=1 Tax=Streptomyces sp. NPDC093094 TaxID=3366026 RepID=UPI00382E6D17
MNEWAVPGYTESQELGAGASGRVVLAVHRETGVPVAVKYLSDSLRTRPGFVQDFRAEARLLGGLHSPYVAGLYEYVESPDGAAIVMELVDGVSLRTLLVREGPLEPEAALCVLKGSLLGLGDAHRLGVVHRDYKPENVLVLPDGTSRLVDFGIAVDSGISAGIAGTPAYMAPEQWTGEPASPAADVYAATATFFECLTRRKPYHGDNLAELALQHVDAPVPADEVPAPVRELVRRGLAKDPGQRPVHADAFVAELEAAAGAAYGPDWEERGRGRLAALAALLPLLLPPARTTPRGTTDIARTVLAPAPVRGGLRAWLPGRPGVLVSAALVLLGVLLAHTGPPVPGAAPGAAAQALATTSAGTGGDPAAPGTPSASATAASPSPEGSPSASVSPSASPSESSSPPSASPTDPPDPTEPGAPAGTSEPPAPPGGTAAPPTVTEAPPTSAPPTVAPPTGVKDVTLSAFQQTGALTATATFTVTTDGTGPVAVTVGWFLGNTPGEPGAPDGAAQTVERSGATSYTVTVDHTFQSRACYWTVQATTTPASSDGGASQQLLTRQCELR